MREVRSTLVTIMSQDVLYRVIKECKDIIEKQALIRSDQSTSIPADPNVKNYSYAIVDGQVYYRENSRMVRPDFQGNDQNPAG